MPRGAGLRHQARIALGTRGDRREDRRPVRSSRRDHPLTWHQALPGRASVCATRPHVFAGTLPIKKHKGSLFWIDQHMFGVQVWVIESGMVEVRHCGPQPLCPTARRARAGSALSSHKNQRRSTALSRSRTSRKPPVVVLTHGQPFRAANAGRRQIAQRQGLSIGLGYQSKARDGIQHAILPANAMFSFEHCR